MFTAGAVAKIFAMAASEKKFFPVLYPKDGNPEKLWFIKYRTPCYVKGGWKYEKYTGLLNRVADIQERRQLAQQYINAINKGEPLPCYQGLRTTPAQAEQRKETGIAYCCERWFKINCHGLKKATVQKRHSMLNIFYRWLQQNNLYNKSMGAIGETQAQDYMAYLSAERKLSGSTYNGHRSLLHSVWKFYARQVPYNPWAEIPTRKRKTQHLQSYPEHLRQHIRQTLPKYHPQLWLFMQCVYYCAIRPQSELRHLQVKHFNYRQKTFTVPEELSKTGKQRTVYVYGPLCEQLQQYIGHAAPDAYLFALNGSTGTKPVSKNHFGRLWNAYRTAHHIPAIYKLYGSKHTAGKELSRKYNTYVTKEHFDHSTTAMTDNYITGMEKEKLKVLVEGFPVF